MLRCHRCRSMNLILRETRYDHAEFNGGLFIRDDGKLAALGDGYFSPGDVQPKLTEIECESCGHSWHPRRDFAGTVKG
jgi:hypothetical protein